MLHIQHRLRITTDQNGHAEVNHSETTSKWPKRSRALRVINNFDGRSVHRQRLRCAEKAKNGNAHFAVGLRNGLFTRWFISHRHR